MTALIKSSEPGIKQLIQGLDSGILNSSAKSAFFKDPVVDERDAKIAALQAEIADLKQKQKTAQAATEKAIQEAKELGREEAIEAVEKDETKSFDQLKLGIEEAKAALSKTLSNSDAIALAIAQTSMKAVFGQSEQYAELLTRLTEAQMRGLRRDSILNFRVNSKDFSDPTTLEAFVSQLALQSETVEIDDSLDAGTVEVDLKLGHLELSVPYIWQELTAKCEELANGI